MTKINFQLASVCGFLISISGCNDTELRGIATPAGRYGTAIAPTDDDEVYVLDIPTHRMTVNPARRSAMASTITATAR